MTVLIVGCKNYPAFSSDKVISGGMEVYVYELIKHLKTTFRFKIVAGMGKTLQRTDKVHKGIFTRLIYSGKKLNILQNNIKCEAHRELIITYLRLKRSGKL